MATNMDTGRNNPNQQEMLVSESLPGPRSARGRSKVQQLDQANSWVFQSSGNKDSMASLKPASRPSHLRSQSDLANPSFGRPTHTREPPASLDLSQSKALMQVRNHSASPRGPMAGYPASISSRSPPAQLPNSASSNSLPEGARIRDHCRHSNKQVSSPSTGSDPRSSRLNPNRESYAQHRSSIHPANLINCAPGMTYSSRPLSMANLEPERIVTGILQSALPISSRPVQVPDKPAQSMSIHELEERHKVALQRLQRKSNQNIEKVNIPTKKIATSEKKTSRTVQRKKDIEDSSAPKSPVKSLKPEKSKRKSFFGFFSGKTTSTEAEIPDIINSRELSSIDNTVEGMMVDGNLSDEDVPLAQLRKTKAFHRSQTAGNLTKANKPAKDTNHQAKVIGSRMSQSLNSKSKLREMQLQQSRFSPTAFEVIEEHPNTVTDKKSPYNSRQPLPLPSYFNHAGYGVSQSMSSGALRSARNSQYIGPRPAIFEAEAQAIRNSKRYSFAPKIMVENFENQPISNRGQT
ncbi:hypothetical protein BY996DRAFT_22526 [Phakopsora pachyrhizi]|nr:hypothetical protein BY996DRAFT_22526 [Phakopsora pachyrhizi]